MMDQCVNHVPGLSVNRVPGLYLTLPSPIEGEGEEKEVVSALAPLKSGGHLYQTGHMGNT